MKNQYVGDRNDYYKYGLLRTLAADGGLRIGICWMLTPDEGERGERQKRYLEQGEKYRLYDPELFDQLKVIVGSLEQEKIKTVEKRCLIPRALFFSDQLKERELYFKKMLSRFRKVDLIFFDPDTGLELERGKQGSKRRSKHLCWAELKDAFDSGHSVLVYQHFPREKRKPFVSKMLRKIKEKTKAKSACALAMSDVVFLLAVHQNHKQRLERLLRLIRQAAFASHIRFLGDAFKN